MSLRATPFLFAALLTVIGCSAPEDATIKDPGTPDHEAPNEVIAPIRFGSSHGMCMGYCTREFELKTDGLTARRKGGGRGDVSAYPDQEQLVALDKASLQVVMAEFDTALFDASPDTIGCPDCADGGRCWVEVVRDGKPRTVIFDCHGGSEALKPFTDALWRLAEQVKWAEGGN